MNFSVWAPIPTTVKVNIEGRVVPMTADGAGWWTVDVDVDAEPVTYGFVLDDDPTPLPDPRSRFQPEGVHGLSQTYDPTQFVWTDAEWAGRSLAGGVIYELHLGTFTPTGTLDAAIERLPHLVELGIDFVELLPVNAFNGTRNWGYDGVLWYCVDDRYGGPAAYQRFVDACHRHGLAVVQDVVYNHLGPSGNYLPSFGPYLRDDDDTAWGASINLDDADVRRYISTTRRCGSVTITSTHYGSTLSTRWSTHHKSTSSKNSQRRRRSCPLISAARSHSSPNQTSTIRR